MMILYYYVIKLQSNLKLSGKKYVKKYNDLVECKNIKRKL